ncbi:hypothetical protein ES703_72898 [subsurface metagenome]
MIAIRKKFIITVLLVVIAGFAFGDIGENFEAAGIQLFGEGSLNLDMGNIFRDGNKWYAIDISFHPGFGIFLIDNVSIWLAPGFNYNYRFHWDEFWAFQFGTGFLYLRVKSF